MVLTEMDSNAILVKPMQNQQSGEMMAASQILINCLKENRFEPKTAHFGQ